MRLRPRYSATAITVAAVTLTVAVCGCTAPKPVTTSSGPGPSPRSAAAADPASVAPATGCQVQRGDVLSSSDMRGYTQFVGFPRMALPLKSRVGYPLWFQRDYLCGELYGFITNAALTGRYRQENNARARELNYRIQKYPYVPLTGSIVARLPHDVFEVYEALYEFSTSRASAAFLQRTSQGSLLARPLTIPGLPSGTVAIQHSMGLQRAVDEQAIFLGIHIGDFAVTVSFQGGRLLAWNDVQPYWHALAAHLPEVGRSANIPEGSGT
jgi:hypothetical protein